METRTKIDSEVKSLTEASYKRAKDLLTKHAREHKLLAKTLMEYETLTGDEVRTLVLEGGKPDRPIINIPVELWTEDFVPSMTREEYEGGVWRGRFL